MAEAQINGIRLHYEDSGSSGQPALLLSNSLGTSLDMWWPQLEPLNERFRVVRYDSRGHGGSEVQDGEYTLDTLGRDALGLLDHLGIDSAAVCGVSKGGMVGMWLAAHAPERISRAVFANTSAHFGAPDVWQQRIDLVTREGMGAIIPALLERWFTASFRERDPDAVERTKAMLLATDPRGYTGCCAAIRDMDLRENLGAIRAPVLVIGGLQDPATPPEATRYIAAHVAGAKLVELDCAHLSNIELADAFNDAVGDFL